MAKLCKIAKEKQRALLVKRASVKRAALREVIKGQDVEYKDKLAAVQKLNKMPRDGSAIRLRRRCLICGRPRGVYRKFGLCRIHLREAFVRGDVPGLLKASW